MQVCVSCTRSVGVGMAWCIPQTAMRSVAREGRTAVTLSMFEFEAVCGSLCKTCARVLCGLGELHAERHFARVVQWGWTRVPLARAACLRMFEFEAVRGSLGKKCVKVLSQLEDTLAERHFARVV